MREPKREAKPKQPLPSPENASEGLYELNVDERFHDQGEVNLDSSLGTERDINAPEDPHDPTGER